MTTVPTLAKKRALILGVANERSLAWGIAQALAKDGYELAFTYQGTSLERRVRPLAESVGSTLILPCDVTQDSELEELFKTILETWGSLDVLIHSIAFAHKEDLEGRFIKTSRNGFRTAMEVSVFSLIACAAQAESLMERAGGGTVITLSYYGAEKVVPHYNVMGVAKAALESSVRYLAADLGPKKIRVHAISAGAVKTLAAAGIKGFRNLLGQIESAAPLNEGISSEDVGALAAFLCSSGARHMTGNTTYVDSGAHILASGPLAQSTP